MKIQVLGSGCAKCKKLFELTKQAVVDLNLKAEVEYITDVSKIIEMGLMSSPVLAVDDKAILVGFLPSLGKIKSVLGSGEKNKLESHKCGCGGNC